MYYFLTNYSLQGMGTNTDLLLIDDESLVKLIRLELVRKAKGFRHFNEKFTLDYTLSAFEKDSDKVVSDIISVRSSSVTTYAKHNDLIAVPDDIKVRHRERLSFQIGYSG